jgi:phosphohistidine phosphatase
VRIIIVRHGKAEADSPTGRDEDRRLKKRGERQARWLGNQFADSPPSLIVTSGHQRAIATANLIQSATDAPLLIERRLELGHSAAQALDCILDHARDGALMLVGHNPQLAQLVWVLTQGAPARTIDLRTGEAVILDVDPAGDIGSAAVIERLRMPEDD